MTIDIDKLRAFPIPEGHQTITPNDIALYALSIGMGRDPLDRDQLRFVDPLQGPEIMPAMVLVLAHPGFWMSDPASGVDPKAILHASQGIDLLAPIPTGGEVRSRTEITDVIDKGAGKAALIVSRTDLRDGTDTVFARLTRTTYVRGGGGFGGLPGAGDRRPDEPQGPPDRSILLTTGREQALIYRLNGDLNPLHSDPDFAARVGFDQPILHGLCTMGVVIHALLRGLAEYRPERLRSVNLKFSKPVFPGETIRTDMWKDGRFRAVTTERGVVVVDAGIAEISDAPIPAAEG